MTTSTITPMSTDAFAERLLGMLNDAALALMISIGHRTGLLDTMATLPPATSTHIAYTAGLYERYVREWLGAMVTGGMVTYDAAANTYWLPPTHAASLTYTATPNNLAMIMQFIPLLGTVEDGIVKCFRNGGGLPYAAYPRFQQVMAEVSAETVGTALLDSILPLVPGGIEALQAGIAVLDVGCGCGHTLNVMARAFPRSQFMGYDFSTEGIVAGKAEAQTWGLTNVTFAVQDVAAMHEVERYHMITAFDAIHDQAHPRQVLQGIATGLRPGGTFLMQDIAASSHVQHNLAHPLAPYLYTISCMHCMTVSLALHGAGLGTMWGEEQAQQLLHDAGFRTVEVHRLPHDIINNYYVCTK